MSDRPRNPSARLSAKKAALLAELLAEKGLGARAPGRIERRTDDGPAPLSCGQERLWLIEELLGLSATYNVPLAAHLVGPLDASALASALAALLARHEVLRTCFPREGERPVARVLPEVGLALEPASLEHIPADERWTRALLLANAEFRRPFELERGPLVRAALWRLSAEEHLLLLAFHHGICDGQTLRILAEELGELYAAEREGRASALPALTLQHADFAAWQREALAGDEVRRSLEYWGEKLAGPFGALELPADRPRPARPDRSGAWRSRTLAPDLWWRLDALARAQHATPFQLFLAATQVLLHRMSGQQDVLVGVPVDLRKSSELERLCGFLVNTLVLRTSVTSELTFLELLARVRAGALEALANDAAPFERVVERVAVERDIARNPLFQVMFDHRQGLARSLALEGLASGRILGEDEVHSGTTKVDLAFYSEEKDGELVVSCEYSSELFDAATIERWLERFAALLAGIAADPSTRVGKLPVMDAAERALVTETWARGPASSGCERTVHAAVLAQAVRSPEAVALEAGDERVTYRELAERAHRLARHLVELGVERGEPVALCIGRTSELGVALLAILEAGGAYLPLDPSYPRERLGFMLTDAHARVLVTSAEHAASLPTEGLRTVLLDRDAAQIAARSAAPLEERAGPLDPAYLVYTSGSSGTPKGVACPHRGVLRLFLGNADWLSFAPSMRVLHLAPESFDASVLDVWTALLHGGTVAIHPEEKPTLAGLARSLERHRIDSLFLTTALFHAVVDEAPELLAGLRSVATGGEALSLAHVRRARERFPALRLANCYGPTEATVIATRWLVPDTLGEEWTCAPIGAPIADTHVLVLDERGQPAPIGVAGELFVGGEAIALGYRERPELTAERFVKLPVAGRTERFYRTGDRACWRRDGLLEFLGRVDDQVKLSGHRIEPGEIEARLAELESVARAVVVAREDAPGAKRLVAYVLPRAGTAPCAAELEAHLAARLPEPMRPAAYVVLDALPLSPGGKIDRARLPAPETCTGERIRPANETEELIAGQWAAVLGRESVGRDEDFFELGGHSLLATILIARLRKLLDVDLPLAAFFRERTVERLAREVERVRAASSGPRAPAIERRPAAIAPLSWNQRGLWFLQRLAPESPFYNVPFALELSGELDLPALERALAEIVRRHEALRTTFVLDGGEPFQRIEEAGRFALEVVELAAGEPSARSAEAERAVQEFARAPFDLARGPLFRARLVRTSEREATLAVNVHHMVFDGWSLEVFVAELAALVRAFTAGQPSPLPELPLQVADFARAQRESADAEKERADLEFWQRELDDAPAVLGLPSDRPRPAVTSWRGAKVRHPLPCALAREARAFARAEGSTLVQTLLAAAQVLLARTAGVEDLVVGMPVAGRRRPESEQLIGLFLDVVALRADLSGEPDFRECLSRTRERVLAAHDHQDFPVERLVEALGRERDLSTTPIYQVLFSLRPAGRAVDAGSLRIGAPRELDAGAAKTDLVITVQDDGESLVLDLTYAVDLFEEATVRRLAVAFERLLASALAEPSRCVHELELVDPAERARLLEWSGRSAPFPRAESVATLFEGTVRSTPDAVALVARGETLTYRELNRRANKLAHHLIRLGVQRETRVALCLERSSELVVTLLAILKAGGAYVPLDPAYPTERLAFMLEDSRAFVLLANSHLLADLPRSQAKVVCIDADRAAIESQPATDPPARSAGEDLAYVLYTSGSTGRPKGVEVPHRAIARLVFGANFARLERTRVFLQLAPVTFDASTLELWGALLHGAKLVLQPERAPTAAELERVIAEHGVTTLWLTAAHFNAIVDERPQALAGLAECLTGGEALSVAHVQRAHAHLPGVQLVNGYGPTENTTFTCCHRIPRELDGASSIPIGVPITNTRVYVVDARMQLVPIGVPGELVTGGDGLARGYLGRPELTAERFVANPFGPGKLYRTGDRVRWRADGTLEFLGRTDDQVKIRGHRIEPGEIACVLGEHARVRKAFVAVHADARAGKRLVAYVEPRDHAPLAADELSAWLAERLPEYMLPAAFVVLDALPIGANGKIDRHALPEPPSEPASAARAEPVNEVERHLAGIWQRVLGVERIERDDDFFELGGHSLLAVRLAQAVKDVFGQELSLSALLGAPTLAAQAQLLHRGVGAADSSALVKLQSSGTRPPVFCVCSLGGTVLNQRPLALRLGADQPFYGLQAIDLEAALGRRARIEDYAAAYIEAMKSVAPRGPYVVGGHSFGGIVSYEIAQQLQERGDEVALLFILDSALPNLDQRAMDRLGGVFAFLRGLAWVPTEAWSQLARDPAELGRTVRQKLRSVQARVRSRLGARASAPPAAELREPAGLEIGDIVELAHWPENNRKIAERHWQAVLEYRPRFFPGRVTLFRSRFQSPLLGLGTRLGWERVALGGVDVQPVPGGHLSVLEPPHVDVLARKLRALLQRRAQAA